MRIELNSGGLDGLVSIAAYQADMKSYISKAEKVADSFAAVQKATRNLSGGVGTLQDALDHIGTRQRIEEKRGEDAEAICRKTNSFLDLAIKVDKEVASDVRKNQNKFYEVNPWLKPPVTNDRKSLLEQAWGWLCDRAEDFVEGAVAFVTGFADTFEKVWDCIAQFYDEYALKIYSTVLTGLGATLEVLFVLKVLAVIGLTGPIGIIVSVIAGVAIATTILTAGMDVINTFTNGAVEDTQAYKVTKTVKLTSMFLFTVITGSIAVSKTGATLGKGLLTTLKSEAVDTAADVAEGWATWDNDNKVAQWVSLALSMAALGKGLYSMKKANAANVTAGPDTAIPGPGTASEAAPDPDLVHTAAPGPNPGNTAAPGPDRIPDHSFTPTVEPKGRGLAPNPIPVSTPTYYDPSATYEAVPADLYPSIFPPSPAPHPDITPEQALRPLPASVEVETELDPDELSNLIKTNDLIISCLNFIDTNRKALRAEYAGAN